MPKSRVGASRFLHRHLAIGVGLSIVILGLITLWASTRAATAPAQTFWSNVGTALITTGIVSVIYESLLQASLLEQVRIAVGQAEGTLVAGLTEVLVNSSELDLAKIFAGARRIRIVPEDPFTWQTRHYSSLLESARTGSDIEIHLPTPEAYAHAVAGRQRVPEVDTARRACSEIAQSIMVAWAQSTLGLPNPSVLRVLQYPGTVTGGLVIADDHVVISTGGIDGPEHGSEPLRAIFHARRGTPVRAWADESLARLRSAVIEKSDLGSPDDESRDPRDILPLSNEMAPLGVNRLPEVTEK